MCNTGELLRAGEVEAALKEVDHPFVSFLQPRLARFRMLFAGARPSPFPYPYPYP